MYLNGPEQHPFKHHPCDVCETGRSLSKSAEAEINNEELRHRYAVNNAGSSTRKIFGEKRSWHLKPRYFVVVRDIFLFGGCSVKGMRQGKQRLESIEWKIKHANDSTSIFRGLFRADVIQLCQSAIVWTMRSLRYTSKLIKVFPIVLCRINGEFCKIVLWIDHDSCQNRWHQL